MSNNPDALAKTLMAIGEKVRPMSLHLGVVRIGLPSAPLFDVLYDTTDSDLHLPPFACLVYDPLAYIIVGVLKNAGMDLGAVIKAF